MGDLLLAFRCIASHGMAWTGGVFMISSTTLQRES